MRGSPVMRALVVFAGLLALGPLLWKLTRADAVPPAVGNVPPPAATPGQVRVSVTFSAPAGSAKVLHLGREVWSKAQPGLLEDFTLNIPWPQEGIELQALVEWPGNTNEAAMRVRVTDPANNQHDRTVWGRGSADDVLVFR